MGKLWEKKASYKVFSTKEDSIASIFGGHKEIYIPYCRKYEILTEEQLLELIEDAFKNKWEVLDLTNAGISKLPEQLWSLTSLKVLLIGNEFDGDQIINFNIIKEIPDGIKNLINLEALSISTLKNLKISKYVRNLPKLTYLDCFKCGFTKFPYSLVNKRINSIGIDAENEEVLNRICTIKNIKELYLTWSKLTILPRSVCGLNKLKTLSVANSQISRIPNELCNLDNLINFWIVKTPLEKEVPEEILEQSALEIILYICRQQDGSEKYYFNESKMVIVGQGNVGKSCLLERICDNKYEEKESTEGIAIRKWGYSDKKKTNSYVLNIWDFGGQEIYHSTHQFFLTKRSLYVLVWDARAEEEYGRVDYWLKTIESFAEDSPIIIAINKCDITTTRVNRVSFQEYKEKYPQIRDIIDISCKDNVNIPRLRNLIKNEAKKLPIMRIKWFYEWYKVRLRLEKLAEKKKYIDYSEYKQICEEYHLSYKEIQSLSKYLHDLGIILHYEDDLTLRSLIILSPQWATEAVYKILDSQETILKNRNGILKIDDLPRIWTNKNIYPEDKYVFLLKIMEKFQLCFEVMRGEYLVAELLENAALSLPKGWEFRTQDTINVVYEYDFMPAGVMTRFIVLANQYLAIDCDGKRLCWKKGAYMVYKKAYASVIMYDGISEKKIVVKVNKSSNINDAKELLHVIRLKLREINSAFKKLEVKEYVPCNCNNNCKFKFEYQTLCAALEKGRDTIQCHESFEIVNVLKLLEGIVIDKLRGGNGMYNINIENKPEIKTNINVDTSTAVSQEQKKNEVNIQTGLNEIQGYLQELSEEFEEKGETELVEEITKANNALDSLEKVEDSTQIVKSGKLNKIKRLIEGFSTEDGEYKKLVSGSKNIAKMISGLVIKYNSIASALGIDILPFS